MGEKTNPKPLSHEFSEVELVRAFVVKDRDWNHLFDPNRGLRILRKKGDDRKGFAATSFPCPFIGVVFRDLGTNPPYISAKPVYPFVRFTSTLGDPAAGVEASSSFSSHLAISKGLPSFLTD
ncbi:hypothetical protein F0562_005766 [Nyssa sinensis]|uniref:Uncharacterized protein n=1 Tax=Nyssa sinensis TaxID=561372 RepID=A0A5J5ANR5_9ASTE|nr:hypothetical protein F0562_005766 [Nyssa sinensis]